MLANLTTENWIAISAIIVPFALIIFSCIYKYFTPKNKKGSEQNNSQNQHTNIEKVEGTVNIVQIRETDVAQSIIENLLDRYAKSQQENSQLQSQIDKLYGILEYVASQDKELILSLPETGDTDKINRILPENPYLPKKTSTFILNELGDYIKKTKKDKPFILKKDETDNIGLYKIFIASPSGLERERKIIREGIKCENDNHTIERGIMFDGRGWEDVPPGYGIAQSLINEELYKCKFCILILWDNWGSPPDPNNDTVTSGSEAEYLGAVELKKNGEMEDVAVFFKTGIDSARLEKPDKQLKEVLEFKNKIIEDKKPYFKEFDKPEELQRELSKLLAHWARELNKTITEGPKQRDVFGKEKFDPNED